MKTRHRWTDEEEKALRELYPNQTTEHIARLLGMTRAQIYGHAKRLGLSKSEAFRSGSQSGRFQKGAAGTPFRFQPGNSPWNKGKQGTGGDHPNCRRTQFQPGKIQGRAAQLVQPIGAERVAGGVLQRKVNNEMPIQRRWKSVHSLVWEETMGPVPAGSKVIFKPGMHTTVAAEITVDRLELVTHAELMARNSYHNRYPKEVGLLIQTKGQLTRRINRKMEALREKQD